MTKIAQTYSIAYDADQYHCIEIAVDVHKPRDGIDFPAQEELFPRSYHRGSLAFFQRKWLGI